LRQCQSGRTAPYNDVVVLLLIIALHACVVV
jgi:hypothetical protein